MELSAEWVMTLEVEIGPGTVLGPSLAGTTTIIPITGGRVEGPGWKGRVLPGGADWNTLLLGRYTEFSARYQFVTDDGTLVSVFNEGVTLSDLSKSVIKTRPTFLVDAESPLGHLLYGNHVATLDIGRIGQGIVEIGVFRLP